MVLNLGEPISQQTRDVHPWINVVPENLHGARPCG